MSRGETRAVVVAKAGLLAGRVWAFLRSPGGQRAAAWGVVLLAVALEIIFVGQRALVRYQSYSADAFDLGNMDQAVWNTLHGHPFRFTNRGLDWQGPPTRLGFHVEPILLLIAPLYLLHAGPETLLAVQAVALASGAVPLFALALRHLPAHPWVAAALAGAYLVSPALLGAALWDFHPVALAMSLLVAALWALDARRYGWFVAAAALAALTKEDVALSLIPLGVYLALWRGQPRLGWGIALAAVGWVALCFLVILPHFNGGASGGNNYWYRYAWAGDTPGAAIANVLTHPWLPFQYVLGSAERRGYLALLLRMGGGFGLLAPALWLCALPELMVNVLSTHFEQYSGFYQYNAMLGAYLPVAAVLGVAALYRARADAGIASHRPDTHPRPRLPARLVAWSDRVAARWHGLLARIPIPSRWIAPFVVGWLLLTSVWNLGALNPRLQAFWSAGARPAPHQAQIDALLVRVPPSATVAATDTLNPHLSDRYTIYLLPDPQSYTAEYAVFDIPHAAAQFQTADQRILDAMLASGRYTVVGRVESVILLHRTGPPLTPPPTVGPAG